MPGNSADTGNWCRYDNQPVAPVSDEDDGGGGGDDDDGGNKSLHTSRPSTFISSLRDSA